jgi:hypothetical protein
MVLAIDNAAEPYDSAVQFPIMDNPDGLCGRVNSATGLRPTNLREEPSRYQVRALGATAQAFVEQ